MLKGEVKGVDRDNDAYNGNGPAQVKAEPADLVALLGRNQVAVSLGCNEAHALRRGGGREGTVGPLLASGGGLYIRSPAPLFT